MDVLITGLNTYLGRRAVSHLHSDEFKVTGLVRNLKIFNKRLDESVTADLIEIDLFKSNTLPQDFYLEDLQLGIYFTQVPGLNDPLNMQMELISLRNFIEVCKQNSCDRIVYMAQLMDSFYIDAIQTLFEEYRVKYTVVLKSSAIGKGTILSDIFSKLAKSRYIPYWKYIGNLKFRPISLLDVYRWIRIMPWKNDFISEVIYLGGDESLDYKQLFSRYMQVHHPGGTYQTISISKWMVKLFYTRFYNIHKENFDEFRRIMKYESDVDNTSWSSKVHFTFTSMHHNFLIDK
ncbi:hypothetical protein SF1_40900 [Sphingobacterium faecium NBRC 15299]|jgi:hypothetical protein|uniref:hypothetical protein n=1 Tax=Sphingobacterium faecium TaxID=34087 RepID=UPI000D3DA262|nr:hypothetical protein [Sphingobacterium faecium]PTX13377.1 uncharacterized protein YbjT (DUF2867 family) [Sphingobacterium faecium]GEM66108.1 hypothetical protein SF1_40900 [Sphingobacterium faecium NBRC 15299]